MAIVNGHSISTCHFIVQQPFSRKNKEKQEEEIVINKKSYMTTFFF